MGSVQRRSLRLLACPNKRAYPTLEDAQQDAARHYSCFRCIQGFRMGAYRCVVDPSHHHIGHQP